ncbi:ABC transporter permease [Sporomusa sphaeroides]|uniref:ABC transporter permease n=1 Tax=Sporomusa sphaeroides TaxID=47679 RepID=UPI002B965113|nr:ABC transporter permease [Sporomusa sphaeroides]HML31742.1 ABC transporter permease [Sporomusa sphaeroides]
MGWYAVFWREMIILWKKIGRMGYVFSTIVFPFIYLFSFGLGLGGRVNVDGGYLPFLAKGIMGVTVLLNSFQQTASSVSTGRLYFRNFQSVVLSPVAAWEVVWGIIAAGSVRGIFFGSLVFVIAWGAFGVGGLNVLAVTGLILGSCCFAAMGVVVGMLVKHPDDVSLINNFFITPMIFFGGSFFPLQNLPPWLAAVAQLSPIGTLNALLRAPGWNSGAVWAAGTLIVLTVCFFAWSVWLYSRYSEWVWEKVDPEPVNYLSDNHRAICEVGQGTCQTV